MVGADGLLSRVRELWLKDGGPQYDNRVAIRGRIATNKLKSLPSWDPEVHTRIYAVGGGNMGMIYCVTDQVTVWVANVSYDTVLVSQACSMHADSQGQGSCYCRQKPSVEQPS